MENAVQRHGGSPSSASSSLGNGSVMSVGPDGALRGWACPCSASAGESHEESEREIQEEEDDTPGSAIHASPTGACNGRSVGGRDEAPSGVLAHAFHGDHVPIVPDVLLQAHGKWLHKAKLCQAAAAREWKHFYYEPKGVSFTYGTGSTSSRDDTHEITLPQFSSASVPQVTHLEDGRDNNTYSSDFILFAGGNVWSLDWCPRLCDKPSSPVNCEIDAIPP